MNQGPPSQPVISRASTRQSSLIRLAGLGVILVAVFVFAGVFDIGGRLNVIREWILSLGALGPVVYLLIYAALWFLQYPAPCSPSWPRFSSVLSWAF